MAFHPAPKKKGGGTILLLLLCCCCRPWCLAVPHAMSPGPPPCFGRDTSPWTAQHKNFLPRPRHSKEWPADSLGRCWRGLANGTVPGVD